MTKKNGIRNPKPTAVSLDSNFSASWPAQRGADDHPGDEAAEQQVEPELGGEGHEREDQQHREPHRELAARLERALEVRPAPPSEPHRDSASSSATAMNASRISASWTGWVVESTRVIRRIGPNSPMAPAASR